MAFRNVLFGLGTGHALDGALLRLAVMDHHAIHRRKDHKPVGIDKLGELRGGKVLINDRRNADKAVPFAHDGDPAAADRDHHMPGVDQRIHRVLFDHVDGLGARHDLPVAAARVLDHRIALFGGDCFGLRLGIKRADGLGRMGERRIVRVDKHLRHNRGDGLTKSARRQLVLDAVLEVVADIALAHRAALRERHVAFNGLRFRRGAHGKVDHADLRAVAVRDHDLMPGLDQIDNRLRGLLHKPQLFIRRVAERVAAERNDELCHIDFLRIQNVFG